MLEPGSVTNYTSELNLKTIVSKNRDKTLLISFYAPWCPPCNKLEPNITKFCKDNKFCGILINVEENEEIAEIFDVEDIPHVFVFHLGHKIYDFIGADDNNLKQCLKQIKEASKNGAK